MSKMKVVPFKKAHLELLNMREMEAAEFALSQDLDMRLTYIENTHNAETLVYKGVVLGVIGFVQIGPGVIESFLIPSVYLSENKFAFARTISYYKREAIQHYQWHRLQIVTPDDELHIRWATFLGFEREGTLRKFGINGEDHIMWSIVR